MQHPDSPMQGAVDGMTGSAARRRDPASCPRNASVVPVDEQLSGAALHFAATKPERSMPAINRCETHAP